jgi:alpha-amylase
MLDTARIPTADPGSTLPDGWQFGAMYQVFVRAFADSDGDGIGDLRGLIGKLDYLQTLGVTGLWLMPITSSQDRDHGYGVKDYRAIEADYGSMADFDALLTAAHERGIGVILDYVMNHSAKQHPAFQDAVTSTTSPFRDWYIWSETHPAGWNIYGNDPWHPSETGWYFGAFWGEMPDWNLRHRPTVLWHHDNMRFWLNRGVDGFRFDAVGNLIEDDAQNYQNESGSYELVCALEVLIDRYRNRYMVVEAPTDPLGFARMHPGGSAFAFGHHADLINAARGDTHALHLVAGFPPVALPSIATMLSNHDGFAGARVCDQLGGDLARMKLAAAMYLLQPGVPFIYYGEEIGMAGAPGLPMDPSLRPPMSWTGDAATAGFTTGTPFRALSANATTHNVAAQDRDPDSLLQFYRAMLGMRRARPSIAMGGYRDARADGPVMQFVRELNGEQTVVLINVGSEDVPATIDGLTPGRTYVSLYPLHGPAFRASEQGTARGVAHAMSVRVFGTID